MSAPGLDRLDDLVADKGGDWGIRLEGGLEYAWSAELRLTRHPNAPDGPDRSVVLFAVGGQDPDDAIAKVIDHALAEVEGW